MKQLSRRAGFTLLETLLFLGILSIMSVTIVMVFLSTQEARVRQKSIAAVEQSGTQVVELMTKNVRRAEQVLAPASGSTGSVLTLQMALNSEYPTIFSRVGSGNLLLVQRSLTSALLQSNLHISNLVFRNVNNTNVYMSFILSTTIPTIPPSVYTRTFQSTATLYPDDQSESGGCGTCPSPSCNNHLYEWYICESGTCQSSATTFAC
jgi:type II secretory pathway pseudopilin PulG